MNQMLSNRILFVKHNCPFCRKYYGIVEDINRHLKPEKRVQKIYVEELEPIVDKFAPYLQKYGTPFLYMNGYVVAGMSTEEFVKGFLIGFLKKTGEL